MSKLTDRLKTGSGAESEWTVEKTFFGRDGICYERVRIAEGSKGDGVA